MDKYLTVEEVDAIRNQNETNEEWEIRRQFIVRHISEYPKNRLLCLAQTFLNINFLGCVYNEELTREVNKLGHGIINEVKQNQRSFNKKSSEGLPVRKKAKIDRNNSSVSGTSSESVKKKVFIFLKAQSGVTDKGLEPLQRLNQIVSRVKVDWELTTADDVGILTIDGVVILANKFLMQRTAETKQYAAAAALHGITAENSDVRVFNGRFELWHNDIGPSEYYVKYLKNILEKARAMLPATGPASKRLEIAFRTSGALLEYRTKQGKGWEQEISFTVLNVMLGSKVLRKGDCTKSKEKEHTEALAAAIIEILMKNQYSIQEKDSGFLISSES